MSQINVQRQDGDKDAETWTAWAYRNRWKIAGGVAAVAALSAVAYYAYRAGNAPKVSMDNVPSATTSTGSVVTSSASGATDAATSSVGSSVSTGGSEILSISAPAITESVTEGVSSGSHAWPVDQPYTVIDKLKGLVGLLPGGGAAVKAVETYLDPSLANQEQLVAEIAKLSLGPAAIVPSTWDNVATILSYYSKGSIEIGTTVDLIRKAGQGMVSMEKELGTAVTLMSSGQ